MRVKPQNFLRHREPECPPFLNMQIQTSHSTLKLGLTVEKLLEELEDKFPPVNPHPKEQIESIMYKAGQRSLITWIQSRIDEEEL